MALHNPRPMSKGERLEIRPSANGVRLEKTRMVPGELDVGPEWQLEFSFGNDSTLCVPVEASALRTLWKIAVGANAAEPAATGREP